MAKNANYDYEVIIDYQSPIIDAKYNAMSK